MTTRNDGGVVLLAVGDVGFVGAVADKIRSEAGRYPFESIAPILEEGDIVIGNLEIPLLDGPARSRDPVIPETLVASVDAAARLKGAGFHLMNLANNHILDHGAEGVRSSKRALSSLGIAPFGAGDSEREARMPAIVERLGVRFGFLGYTASRSTWATQGRAGAAPMAPEVVEADLRSIRSKVDVVVLSLHFGLMYTDYPQREDQARLRHWAECGADVILGHHPHVCQGVEMYGKRLIAYSLGEFVFDPRAGNVHAEEFAALRRQSMIIKCTFRGSRLDHWEYLPIMIGDDLSPRLPSAIETEAISRRIERISTPLAGDGLSALNVVEHAGTRLARHELRVLAYHLRRMNLGYVVRKLARVRPRHLRMLVGYLGRRLPRSSGAHR